MNRGAGPLKAEQSSFALGGRRLTRIGLGTNRLTDSAEHLGFLGDALAAGIDFIDTAHLYGGGASEGAVGRALKSLGDEVVVATKGGFHSNDPAVLRAELATSLERLRTEAIDLYYLHRIHADAAYEATLELLAEQVGNGRIRQLGLSEVGIEEIETARAIVDVAAVQNEYGLGERMHEEVIDYCDAEGIAFVPFYPLAGGDSPALLDAARRHGVSPSQIKLAWLLSRSPCVVPIPGTLSIAHLRENLAALAIELEAGEREAIAG
jgi:aryl-alcohol dehydrogenase-like predicted oxidoreductase